MIREGLRRSHCTICGERLMVDLQVQSIEVVSPMEVVAIVRCTVPADDRIGHERCIADRRERMH